MKMFTKKAFSLLVAVFLIVQGLFAQPPNDACSGAFPVTPDGTCYGPGLPETTTAGSADLWVGQVGCAGNNNEVWFSFVATASQLDVNITAGTIGGNIEFTLVSSLLPPCNGLSIVGAACGPSPIVTSINGLQVGTTYYYTISNTGSDGTFTTCVDNVVPLPVSGQDCPAAAILCDGSTFAQGGSSSGFGAQEVSTGNSCWGSGGERQSKWFHFTIGCTGTLEFNINPVVSGNDYDWGLWDITGDITCGTKGNTVACNWSGCKGSTGITTCPGANPEPGRVASGSGCFGGPAAWNIGTFNVTAGQTYALLVDNFSTSSLGFSLTFGGACGGGTAVIGPDANFTGAVDVTCMIFTGTKVCPTTNSTFLWNYGDGSTSTGQNGSHVYATTGNFNVSLSVTDELGCTNTTSQAINIGCLPLPIELLHFEAQVQVDKTVELSWITMSEEDNDYFTVERGTNGHMFTEIGTKEGADNSTEVLEYSLLDRNPLEGISYYRLKQTDHNGVSTYSNTVAINFDSSFEELSIAPNPVENNSVVSFIANSREVSSINITDVSGKRLISTEHDTYLGNNSINLNTSNLKQGVYFLTIQIGDKSDTIKFIKN
ncbi:MAG: hypothetical protein ACI837_001825 [Crocinitomicaceae bacterium]|jgi:hypothetical protein